MLKTVDLKATIYNSCKARVLIAFFAAGCVALLIGACDRSPPPPPPNTTDPCALSYSGPAPTQAQCQNCSNQVGCMACCGRLAAPPPGGCRNWCGSSSGASIESDNRFAQLEDYLIDSRIDRVMQRLTLNSDMRNDREAALLLVQQPPRRFSSTHDMNVSPSDLLCLNNAQPYFGSSQDDRNWPSTADVIAEIPVEVMLTIQENGRTAELIAYLNRLQSWGRDRLIWEVLYLSPQEWNVINNKLQLALPSLNSYLVYWATDPAWSGMGLNPSRCQADRFRIFDAMFDWWLSSPELQQWVLSE